MIAAKVIKPVNVATQGVFRNEMLREAQQLASDVRVDFGKTVKTWKHKPKFETQVTARAENVSVAVGTNDEIYGYVDKGTKPHVIRAKRKRILRFNTRFVAKTRPHVIGSTAGKSGPPEAFAPVVHHPGTDAREFVRDIQAKYQPKLAARMQTAINRAAKITSK